MSVLRRTPPTRHALLQTGRRLERVRTAAELLSRKRSALVNELFRTARPVLETREAIEWQAAVAYAGLLHAEADRGHAELHTSSLPLRDIRVELRATESWGMRGAEIVARDPIRRTARDRNAGAGPAATTAATEFEALAELLLDAASRELLIRRIAHAFAETSRRVNLLERRVAPRLSGELKRIASTLEEREREEQLRYRRLLDRPSGAERHRR